MISCIVFEIMVCSYIRTLVTTGTLFVTFCDISGFDDVESINVCRPIETGEILVWP